MISSQKALQFTFKSILPRLFLSSFSQTKSGQVKNSINTPFFIASQSGAGSLTTNIGYGITQVKNTNEILHEIPVENYLKKIQKTVETIHCFNPKTKKQIDVPIRIFRTHYTVTFLPSEQYLEKYFTDVKQGEAVYSRQKDSVLSTYKYTCKSCGNYDTRTFPQNGYKFGTVITGCDHCNHVELVSDHLGWIQNTSSNMSKDLMFNKKYVHDLIKKNLKKVGIDSQAEPQ